MKEIILRPAYLSFPEYGKPSTWYPEVKAWTFSHYIKPYFFDQIGFNPSDVVLEGDNLKIIEHCLCANYEHEITYYPREGLKRKELKAEDIVSFRGCFQNFYGEYCIVSKDGILYHVKPVNLRIIFPYTLESLKEKVQKL